MEFKKFILNENKAYLGEKVGDILSALHNLKEVSPNLGNKQISKMAERIVDQIRRILHSDWPGSKKSLLKLQKIGTSIMKSIEEKQDLLETIEGATQEMEQLSAELGVPVNVAATPQDIEQPSP
jgi:HPt (histidine-containing phosphotransfer) domain-containing protein